MAHGESRKSSIKTITLNFLAKNATVKFEKVTVPSNSTPKQLETLLHSLLKNKKSSFSLTINENLITAPLNDFLESLQLSVEIVHDVIFEETEPATVCAVTRCTSALPGHSSSILVVKFSPDCRLLATGSGDQTVRLWDISTETPVQTLKGHSGWVQAVSWSPDSKILATGCLAGVLMLWEAISGKNLLKTTVHKKGITDVAWEPFHRSKGSTQRFASASTDGSIKIWSRDSKNVQMSLTGHTAAVTCVCWGGQGWIYSSSRDTKVRVWSDSNGRCIKILSAHSHWVNHISLSTDQAIRSSYFDFQIDRNYTKASIEDLKSQAKAKYQKTLQSNGGKELLVSGSDDNTAILWDPSNSDKPLERFTGHTKPVSFVRFSPNGKLIVSVSFDRTAKLWKTTPKYFQSTFKGHISAIFQVCWSSDSRFLVTGSRDSTLKVWGLGSSRCKRNLPSHEDEVYAVDWSADGEKVASGGKDKILRIWRK